MAWRRLFSLGGRDPRRVYIWPTRQGVWFLWSLLLMLWGSANYNLNLGFGLTFLLAGMAFVALLQAWRSVRGVTARFLGAAPVFVGQEARFALELTAPSPRLSLRLAWADASRAATGQQADEAVDLEAQAPVLVELSLPATQRGRLRPGSPRLDTIHPLGLFRAWRVLDLTTTCLVYPRPAPQAPEFGRAGGGQGEGETGGPGVEDFQELRPYAPGDPPQRIHWKASLRGQGLFVKEFAGLRGVTALLDFDRLDDPDPEVRLSQLCAMVLKARSLDLDFVLRLPGRELIRATEEHPDAWWRRCLQALALHGADHD